LNLPTPRSTLFPYTTLFRSRNAGIADAAAVAPRIYDLEKRLAATHATREDSEDVVKGNNHWKREEFATRAPGLDWNAFFAAASRSEEHTSELQSRGHLVCRL